MRVLVTGHLGYIGTAMVPMLLRAGHEVVGLDSDLYENCTFAAGGTIAEVPHIQKDVRDADARDLEGFDAVIHLAALSNDPLGNLNPDITYSINHRASVRLARLAKAAGVRRFLLASSCSNYGVAGEEFVITPAGSTRLPPTEYPRCGRSATFQSSPAMHFVPFTCAQRPHMARRHASVLTSCSTILSLPGGRQGTHLSQVRWLLLAADRAYRRHFTRLHRGARGACSARAQPGVQCRLHRTQLPH